ncbi:MAG: phosphoribosylformylglycinamidine synthase subunit PurS [Actinomycetota bacterium]|nr:phosphoribosylformylglycinamidine synthase subunit PurS [Actinomycetota bacterium]
MRFDVLVEVALRPGIADPQGATIERALPALGFQQVSGVRTGKAIRFSIEADGEPSARIQVDELCRRFLTNPVIEEAHVTLAGGVGAGGAAGGVGAGGAGPVLG